MRNLFEIDEENSINRLDTTNPNAVGYRSLHLVASLGRDREQFPEYRGLTDYKFEIQIRTALQHAWAEIEHRENYKSTMSLPPKLQRRLMLIAGTLESIDREFGEIVKNAKNYSKSLEAGDVDTYLDPLSTVAIKAIFSRVVKKARVKRYVVYYELEQHLHDQVSLLSRFGVNSVGDFEGILSKIDLADIKIFFKFVKKMSIDRFCRFLMIMNDSNRYFASLEHPKRMHVDESVVNYYEENHPHTRVSSMVKKYKIVIIFDVTGENTKRKGSAKETVRTSRKRRAGS